MLLLSDDINAAHPVRKDGAWFVVPLEDALSIKPMFNAIACEVALENPASVDLVKVAIGHHRRGSDTPVLFIVRDYSILTHARANALGATHVVPFEDLSASSTVFIPYRERGETSHKEPLQEHQTATHVKAAEHALDTMFRAAKSNQKISSDGIKGGADAVVDAIKGGSISDWIGIVRKHDDVTFQHVLLVAGLVAAFTARLGYSPKAQRHLTQAALLHDIGKARIPLEILNKPGQLSKPELDVMRTHPVKGYYMICDNPGFDEVIRSVVLRHHEFLDGSGYPGRLRKNDIDEFIRLTTICDIYGALIEARPYKAQIPPEKSYAILREMGDKLDQELVVVFHDVVETIQV